MRDENVGSVVITNDNSPTGVVTDRDLTELLADETSSLRRSSERNDPNTRRHRRTERVSRSGEEVVRWYQFLSLVTHLERDLDAARSFG